MITLKKGSRGNEVKALQYLLEINADGIFGTVTKQHLMMWQAVNGLDDDGVFGPKSQNKMCSLAPTVKKGDKGKWVFALEILMGGVMTVDGSFSIEEDSVVRAWQSAQHLAVDGKVGPKSWLRLFGLSHSESANIKPTDFKQYDSKWKYNNYTSTGNKSQTMSNSGCGPTAAADIVNTFKSSYVNPWTLAQLYVKNGFRTKNSGTAWAAMEWTAKKYKFARFQQTASFSVMKAAVADGAYCVVSFGPSKWTKAGHYCVIWNVDEKYIYVNDPASSSSTRAQGTYSECQAAAKQYFLFWP